METIVQNVENKEEMLVLFFSYSSYLSNFYRCNFEVDNTKFTSMEQFFHYKKAQIFKDKESMTKILATNDPKEQKRIGRSVKQYNESKWARECYTIMKQGLYAKFDQNPILKERMLSISNARFVEASPYDKKWGIGIKANHPDAAKPSKWPGKNMLGQALDDVRDTIRYSKKHINTKVNTK